jgi:hypothetical protein
MREDRLLAGVENPRRSCLGVPTLIRQIDRGGARQGLAGREDHDGRTKLCDMQHRAVVHFGLVDVRRDSDFILCSVDDRTPLSVAMRNRVRHGELDPYDRWRRYLKKKSRHERQAAAALDYEIQDRFRTRNRIMATPNGISRAPIEGIREKAAAILRRMRGR